MDLTTFLTKIQLFSRFPEGTMQYASNVAGKISDAERAGLYTKLEQAYGEYITLDDARIAQQSTMIEELVNFKKTHLPALQKKIEAADIVAAEHIFDEKK